MSGSEEFHGMDEGFVGGSFAGSLVPKSASRFQEKIRRDRQKILSRDNISDVSDECDCDINLEDLVDEIGQLVRSCFEFDINPLTHLRRYFPEFAWVFKEFEEMDEFLAHASNQDYNWVAFDGGEWTEVVSARRVNTADEPFRYCVCREAGIHPVREPSIWPKKEKLDTVSIRLL